MFDAMLTNATRLCEAILGALYRYEGGLFHPAALTGAPPALADFIWQRGSFVPAVGAALDRLLQTKTVVPLGAPRFLDRKGVKRRPVAVMIFLGLPVRKHFGPGDWKL